MNPPSKKNPARERLPICQICRRRILPESSEDGSVDASPEGGQSAALPPDYESPKEVAPIGSSEHRSVTYPAELNDRTYIDQFVALDRLEAANRRPGANLTAEADRIASHPKLRDWLRESDRIADKNEIGGREYLVRQRRLGILRFLEGEDQGFPINQPVPRHLLPRGQGFWLLRLRGELEWLVTIVIKPTVSWPYGRPTKDRLNSCEARAILDWTACSLESWLSNRPHRVRGRISIEGSRRVMFETATFIDWVYSLMNS